MSWNLWLAGLGSSRSRRMQHAEEPLSRSELDTTCCRSDVGSAKDVPEDSGEIGLGRTWDA
jgi:hypothetical protein